MNRVAAKKYTLNGLSMHQLSKLICKNLPQNIDLFLINRLSRKSNKKIQNISSSYNEVDSVVFHNNRYQLNERKKE